MFSSLTALYADNLRVPKAVKLRQNHIKYGITTTVKLDIVGDAGTATGKRPNAFFGNVTSLLGKAHGILVNDVGIHDGIRSDVMTTDCQPSAILATEVAIKARLNKQDNPYVHGIIERHLNVTNAVSPLYNLLRLFFILSNKDLVYDGKLPYYDNGHISITNDQMFANSGICKLGDSIDINDGAVHTTNAPLKELETDISVYIKWTDVLDSHSHTILKAAFSPWKCEAPYQVAHASPALAADIALPGVLTMKTPALIEDITADMVMAFITRFVGYNSLYRDFEYAYMMFVGGLFRPVPRSAESAYWYKTSVAVNMPGCVMISGAMPELYSGVPFAMSPDWKDTFMSWHESPGSVVPHSIALNEGVYTELYNVLMTRPEASINMSNFVSASIPENGYAFEGIVADWSLLAMRYGREYTIHYPVMCGFNRMGSLPLASMGEIEVTVKDSEASAYYAIGTVADGRAPLAVSEYVPITYPVLSYGVNVDDFYQNATKAKIDAKFTMHRNTLVYTDVKEFSAFMSAMRMFGYDVVATDVIANTKVTNWADNASGRFLYSDAGTEEISKYVIKEEDITERENCWIKLPTLYGKMSVSYEFCGMVLTIFSGPEKITFSQGVLINVTSKDYDKAVDRILNRQAAVKIVPLKKVESGFHWAVIEQPGHRPILGATSLEAIEPPLIQGAQYQEEIGDAEV